ncbi:hypothetical protein AAG906_026437 [Vitis piasezkii]
MASLRDAILGPGQRIDGHQAQPLPIPGAPCMTLPHHHHHHHHLGHLDLLYSRTTYENEITTCFDGIMDWDGYDDMPSALLLSFACRIERYTGIGCPRIHLQLYNTIMREHRLDEAQMIMLFPLSLSGAAQRWFASLDPSRRRTWADLGQEFIRQPLGRGRMSQSLHSSPVGGRR